MVAKTSTVIVSTGAYSRAATGFHARADGMNETSASNKNTQVSQASAINSVSFQDATNDTSFKDFDDMTNHADTANDMLCKVSCEEHHLRKQRFKRVYCQCVLE